MTTHEDKQTELQELKARVADLETELHPPPAHWEGSGSYLDYHATSGFMLGMFGAIVSLLFNVIGSLLIGQHPMRLIQVYLTFPLGERALSPEFDSGIALAVGCCLYVGTGMVLGVPFQIIMARALPKGTLFPATWTGHGDRDSTLGNQLLPDSLVAAAATFWRRLDYEC